MTETMTRSQMVVMVRMLFKNRHWSEKHNLDDDAGTHGDYLMMVRHFIRRIRNLDNARRFAC